MSRPAVGHLRPGILISGRLLQGSVCPTGRRRALAHLRELWKLAEGGMLGMLGVLRREGYKFGLGEV